MWSLIFLLVGSTVTAAAMAEVCATSAEVFRQSAQRAADQVLAHDEIKLFQASEAFISHMHFPAPVILGLACAGLMLLAAALCAVICVQCARQRRLYAALLDAESEAQSLSASLEHSVAERTGELEAARHALRTVLDAVPPMIGYWDHNRLNRFANRAYAMAFGRPPETMAGQPMWEVLGEQLYSFASPYVDAVLKGNPQVFERVVPLQDGTVRYHLGKFMPDLGVDGTVNGFYALISDITDIVESRQALASALRENDVLVRTINEQMLYSVTDTHGIILEVNDNFCAALGYRREELIGVHYCSISTDRDAPSFRAAMRDAVALGRTWNGTFCNRGVDGTLRWFDTVVAPYFNEHGVIERYVALHTEVTARQEADASLRHVSMLLSNVLRAASEISVIATDVDGLITVFNAGAERMLGYSASEMVGFSSPMILHDSEELAARADELHRQNGVPTVGFRSMMQLSERDGAETREWTYVRKDGSRFPVLLTATAIRDDSGTVLGFLGIGVDISARKRGDAILLESMQRAEHASVAKSQFVANMSHEIRTPMNAILGMLELTLRTELTARQRDYIAKARSAGATLLTLLNDVLDFSKIDAGKLELDIHEFEVDALLRDLAIVLSGNHVNNQVEVTFDVSPLIPDRLLGDRERIRQVLVNLTGNALKFTQAGRVTLEVNVLAIATGTIQLRFCVIDSGIGILASQLDMIFDGFTQAEASTARHFGGTGLGLAISARIVDLMGGTLQVSSEVGRGSRFWFDITLDIVEGAALPQVVEPDVQDVRHALIAHDHVTLTTEPVRPPPHQRRLVGLRLLVVEDNALNRQVAFELLAAEGAQVNLANGGRQGINMVTESNYAYDAVIMDVQMPDVDGLEATRRIRALPAFAHLPIIAMTANASLADRDACLAAGMNSHIGKPFDISQVVLQVLALVAGAPSPPPVIGSVSGVALIDLASALPRFFGDVAIYTRFLDDFERESQKLLTRLKEEQARSDASAEAATRHALKGMALTMGAQRLAQALAVAETPGVCARNYTALSMLAIDTIAAARTELAQLVGDG
jgi:PAS domain S-box-containing protein